MKKTLLVSFAAVTALSGSNIDESFKSGKLSGQIRAAYVNQDNAIGTDTYGTSLGGQLKYETGSWNDIKLGIAAYVSQKLPFASGKGDKLNSDFFDADGDSFVYLGEAYIDYSANDFNLRVGRQQIETPFAHSDDVRMLPNSFEAAIASYSGIENTTVLAGYARRWAGYDSPTGHNDSLNEFKKFGENHDSSGLYLFGVTNESFENLSAQGWVYLIDNYSDIAYADAAYTIALSEIVNVELNGQYAHFNEGKDSQGNVTGIDGDVYGAAVNINFGMVALGAAYNRSLDASGKFTTNGLGGGPYFTSMEEMTIDGLEDAKAYQLNAELDMSGAGLEGLTLAALYGSFKGKTDGLDAKVREFDVVLAYELNENVYADMSYASIDDKNKNTGESGTDGGYDRFLVRLTYSF